MYHLEKKYVYGCWEIRMKIEHDTTMINLVETNLHSWHDIHTPKNVLSWDTHNKEFYISKVMLCGWWFLHLCSQLQPFLSKLSWDYIMLSTFGGGVSKILSLVCSEFEVKQHSTKLLYQWQNFHLVKIDRLNYMETTVHVTLFINFSSRSTLPKSPRNWAPALRSRCLRT